MPRSLHPLEFAQGQEQGQGQQGGAGGEGVGFTHAVNYSLKHRRIRRSLSEFRAFRLFRVFFYAEVRFQAWARKANNTRNRRPSQAERREAAEA
jgi:hypothetical protein